MRPVDPSQAPASGGESLVVFPEGTFVAEPGLGRFRLGAFAAAMRGGRPVVPVVIRGSRRILPAGRILPTPGSLEIRILDAIQPDPDRLDSGTLADLARREILDVLGEPDRAAVAAS